MPKVLYGHSMLEIQGALFVFGGRDENGGYQTEIHKISCSSGVYSWTTINQESKIARSLLVAISVPDYLCT